MLYRPDQQELLILGQLAKQHHGRALVGVLEAELKVVKLRLVEASDIELVRQLQGRAKLLQEILSLLAEQARKD